MMGGRRDTAYGCAASACLWPLRLVLRGQGRALFRQAWVGTGTGTSSTQRASIHHYYESQ